MVSGSQPNAQPEYVEELPTALWPFAVSLPPSKKFAQTEPRPLIGYTEGWHQQLVMSAVRQLAGSEHTAGAQTEATYRCREQSLQGAVLLFTH